MYNLHKKSYFIILFEIFFLSIIFYFINYYFLKNKNEHFQSSHELTNDFGGSVQVQRIPGGLVPEAETLKSGACERLPLVSPEVFLYVVNNTFNVNNKNKILKYDKHTLSAQGRQYIYYNTQNKINNKSYIILRYPDFRNEILRHSKENFMNYFNFLKTKIIKHDTNYIFDFTGYHGIIDEKVRLWIKLKEHYGRELADKVMPKTYLIPNDYDVFKDNYDLNKKYILKNSFGGARSALKITIQKDEILSYFEENKSKQYDPYLCIDAACHSKVKYNIIQEYIEPTFLLHNHKFGLRLYFVLIDNPNSKHNGLRPLLWNNGLCYYSNKEYQNAKDVDIDKNVVGSILKEDMKEIIKKYNLPKTYSNFKDYIKKNIDNHQTKIKNLENKLQEYFNYIFVSNKDELNYFAEYNNITKFGIYAFDLEIDKDFNPIIFEGNVYFARFDLNIEYGHTIKELYEDVFCELELSNKNNYGFLKI
jgi:hypothetical protein